MHTIAGESGSFDVLHARGHGHLFEHVASTGTRHWQICEHGVQATRTWTQGDTRPFTIHIRWTAGEWAHRRSGVPFDLISVQENANAVTPRMLFTFGLCYVFALTMMFQLGSTDRGARHLFKWSTSKPHLALCGLLSAVGACGGALGLILHCGSWYLDLFGVVPFLVICEYGRGQSRQ